MKLQDFIILNHKLIILDICKFLAIRLGYTKFGLLGVKIHDVLDFFDKNTLKFICNLCKISIENSLYDNIIVQRFDTINYGHLNLRCRKNKKGYYLIFTDTKSPLSYNQHLENKLVEDILKTAHKIPWTLEGLKSNKNLSQESLQFIATSLFNEEYLLSPEKKKKDYESPYLIM